MERANASINSWRELVPYFLTYEDVYNETISDMAEAMKIMRYETS